MKSNQVSVLIVLLLCLVMGGFLYVVDRSSDDEKGWSPSELYSELGARSYEGSSFSDVTFSGGASSDGVAVSMRNGSFSLRTRASRASSLTPNNPIASSPNNLPSLQGGAGGRLSSSASLIGHMTSSAEFHSFGGGSNMTMGSYTSSSNNLIASSPAIGSYRPSPSSPIALSPNASGVGFNNLPSLQGGDGGRPVVSAEQALMSASSSASGLFGGMMTSYGTASYDQVMYGSYGSNGSGQRGVKGKQNAAPGMGDSWLNWLDNYYSNTLDWWDEKKGNGSSATLDWQAAYNAYLAMLASWNYTMGDPPTWEEFEEWLWLSKSDGFTKNGHTYTYVPIGNILPLVLMAILYMIILFVKRNKTAQL